MKMRKVEKWKNGMVSRRNWRMSIMDRGMGNRARRRGNGCVGGRAGRKINRMSKSGEQKNMLLVKEGGDKRKRCVPQLVRTLVLGELELNMECRGIKGVIG